jgi:hypothetical protein
MPKSNKYPKLTHVSESIENPKMPRGDARMAPMDMEDQDYKSERNWVDRHTNKMKLRHGGGVGPGVSPDLFKELGGEK